MAQRLSRYAKKVKPLKDKKNFHYYLRRLFRPEFSNYVGLISTVILGAWSLYLTIKMEDITR